MKLLPIAAALLLFVACKDKKETPATAEKETTVSAAPLDTAVSPTTPPTTSNDAVSDGSVIGKWNLVDLQGEGVNPEKKKELVGKVTMEFTADGTYIAHSPNDDETGAYVYNAATNQLITTNKAGTKETVTLIISGNGMKVTQGPATMIFEKN